MEHARKIQQEYYERTAPAYDDMHVSIDGEHLFGLRLMVSYIDMLDIKSVLDVGTGTGRALQFLKRARPELKVYGVEPVKELREVALKNGVTAQEIGEGDATALTQKDGEFDLVCEFGILHHVDRPAAAIAEMLRVARKAIFISDSNNFGQGSAISRAVKQALNALGLWKGYDFLKTRGKGYSISEGDGLYYSYSVFNNYRQIEAHCERVHVTNSSAGGINPYRSASHVCLLGVKK